ncbi:MAG: serine/threonine protein kinase [Acidobacteria bacterium]|nr:serine/threonine protein kinase [Acidobacteriota bacterium]
MSICVFDNCPAPNPTLEGRCTSCGSLLKDQRVRERYIVQQVLSRSKFSISYLVIDINRDGASRILKELQAISEEDPDFQSTRRSTVERLFEREARVLMGLQHSGIPRLYTTFEEKGAAYLVEEYIPGHSLLNWLGESKRNVISEVEAREILKELALILKYLHSRIPPIVHRDIKPQNLMRASSDGRLLLVDFAAVSQLSQTSNNTVVGTAGYTPIEQLYGRAVPQSDLYAAGATILRLLTGLHPSKLYIPIEKKFAWEHHANVTPGFACLINGLLTENLLERTSSAEQLLAELEILRPL